MADLVTNAPAAPLVLVLPNDVVIHIFCLDEQHDLPVTFTKHPVERGAPITDHARPEARGVTLRCMASKTPVVADGYDDADELWQTLQDLQATPQLIQAITIGAWYINMGVENISRSIDVKTANAISFTLKLTAIRIVDNKLTQIKVAKDPRAHAAKKAGGISTKTADGAQTAKVQTALRRATLAAGQVASSLGF